jgi:hypothetical protein
MFDEARGTPALFVAISDGDPIYIPRPLRNHEKNYIYVSNNNINNSRNVHDKEKDPVMTHFGIFGQLIAHILLRSVANLSVQQINTNRNNRTSHSNNSEYHSDADDYSDSDDDSDGDGGGIRGNTTSYGRDVLSFDIAPIFWKLVLEEVITLDDIAGYDALMYQNLQYLLTTNHIDELSLTFTATDSDFGKISDVIELEPQGKHKAVTNKNKERYVNLMVKHITSGRMQAQADLVRAGLLHILPRSCVELFSANEIGQLLVGNTKVDIDDWKKHTCYSGWTADNKVIIWFWRLVEGLEQNERSLLLRFCTGASRLPSGGFFCLTPKFTISRVSFDKSYLLPTASTCFNLFKLPAYNEEKDLRRHVMTAILMGSEGFTFS